MKKINIKRLGIILAVLVAIVAMNTVVFAATSSPYNVSISGITRNEYSYSAAYIKSNDNQSATLENLTGASTSLGIRFNVRVEEVTKSSVYYTNSATYSEGKTNITLTYNVSYSLKGGSFRIRVIQLDYARTTSATMTADYTP